MGRKPQRRSKGFTLVAALLLLLLLSGVAVGLMYMVNGESRAGGSDMNYNIAYYAAESGMEKLPRIWPVCTNRHRPPLPTRLRI